MYINDSILAEFERIKHVGSIKSSHGVISTHTLKNNYYVKCDVLVDYYGHILDAKFKAYSCLMVIASTNMFCENIIGRHIDCLGDIRNTTYIERLNMVGVPEASSIMVEEVAADLLKQYNKEKCYNV